MEVQNEIDISHGVELLANGPLMIGEIHDQVEAESRRYLIELMQAGVVIIVEDSDEAFVTETVEMDQPVNNTDHGERA